MNIRKATQRDVQAMLDVAEKLPEWFTPLATKKEMPIDFIFHRAFVAEDSKGILGFLAYTSDDGNVIISWLGVHPDYHGKGIGKRLLTSLEESLKTIGVTELRADTLADTEDYKPYEGTRAFYRKMGFEVEKVAKMYPPQVDEPQDIATLIKYL